ncbi:MAG: SDR family NAD(P)-dependent oxidoreductase [Sphingomonadales bacterium]
MTIDYFDMTGKVVLITGGSRGLGYEMAKAFANQGADIVVASRKIEDCEKACQEIEGMGRKALAQACNVSSWDDLQHLTDAAYGAFGKVDVLINNAGISPVAPSSLETPEALVDKILAVNFKGPFRLMALVGSRMVEAGGGSIINISSIGAIRPTPHIAPYAGAKAGLNAITKAYAQEFGPKVRVNCIMAGPFWTDISKSWREEADRTATNPAGRIGRPHEIVTAALYFGSDASSFTTGSVICVDGGIT